jgi:MoxR-like ATPase
MDRLRRVAKARRTSIAALIRDAVDRTVPDGDADRVERQRRAFVVAGAFTSGRSDVAERHDQALADETRW